MLAMLLVCSCHEEITPIIPVEIEKQEELVLNMSTETITKAIIEGSRLPDNSSVGLFITDDSGFYEPAGYKNIKYTSRSEGGVQVWASENPIYLSDKDATLYSYYPHLASLTSMNLLPVTASSTVQVDYMWGNPVNVSKGNRVANITMKHALAVVRVTFVRGTYSGDGIVSKVSFSGGCAASIAALDITNGTLSNFIGQGAAISPAISKKTLSSTSQKADIIVIPTQETDGKITMTIDGKDYVLEFGDIELHQGEITQFHLTVNDGQLSLSDITVSEWTYSNVDPAEIKVSDKVKITGDIEDIAFYNSVSNGTVTIVAVPKTKSIFEEVEPVTYTGSCTLSQSSDIETGVRTITLSNISSNIEVNFTGTYTYDIVTEWTVTAGEATQMLYRYFYESDWTDILRIREGDKDIKPSFTTTFSSSGKHIYKYAFVDHAVPYDIFENCPALTGVRLSDVVTSLDGYCFSKTSITHFELPETVTYYGSGVLYDCTKLRTVILPRNLTELYDSMFRGCESLTTVDIPDGVTRFGDFAFDGCTSLASIIIPKGVTYIGNYCFSDCSNLRHIVAWPKITPNLGGNYRYNFAGVAKGGVLAVTAEAQTGSNYSYWVASNINLGAYGWTLVYMDE
jgi:hypothetical protein